MNGNFICIKVKRTDGMSAVINVEAIDSICEEDGGVLITAGRTMHSVRCTLDEAIEAVTKNCSFLAQMPLLGFDDEPTEEIEEDAIEPEEAEHVEAEPAEAKETIAEQKARIADIINDYSHYNHYEPENIFRETLNDSSVYLADDGSWALDIRTESDGSIIVATSDGERLWEDLTAQDRSELLIELDMTYRYETMYDWAANIPLEQYIEVYNMTVGARCQVLPNTQENLDKFGMTAGELLKSMVSGNYHKDDRWIYISNDGELISCSDTQGVIEFVELVDYLRCNSEVAKKVMPSAIYSKVFA